MKKIIYTLCLLCIAAFAGAQGLDGIVVEKYYVSNAADSVAANGNSAGPLRVGSVTYRIYVDMAAGYKFQSAFGSSTHTLTMTTTTQFYNNTDRGDIVPNGISATNTSHNTVILDTWLSSGATATGKMGLLKTEDSDGSIVLPPNGGVIQNNDASAGIAVSSEDGMIAGSPDGTTLVGSISGTDPAFTGTGNSFVINGTGGGGAWNSLNGTSGPTAANRVLIAQVTTNGVFHYELNIQLGTPTGGTEVYVAQGPAASGETIVPALSGTLNQPNLAPTAGITAPVANTHYFIGNNVAISDTSHDLDGTVDSVTFLVDGVRIGVATGSSPYTINWTAAGNGNHTLTARATDHQGSQTTSAGVIIVVGTNSPPTVSITAPLAGALYTAPAPVNITASASDADGAVDSVVFYVNNARIGVSTGPTFSVSWTSVIGTADLTARAYDHQNANTLSSVVEITIADPNGLPYKITTIKTTCFSGTFCIPLTAFSAVHNVIGYDVVMSYDKNKVTPTGVISVSSALINPSYVDVINSIDATNGTISISAFFNGSAPANAQFSGTGDVFCVEFTKNANFNSSDTASFSIVSLQESYFTGVSNKLADPGKFITYRDSIFNASLRFWIDNSPLAYNSGNVAQYLITNIYGNNGSCNNKSAVAVQPDLAGNFSHNINNGLDLNIERDIAGTTDVQAVINGFDAFLTRKVLLNDPSFTPSIYQIIAMDVNQDGVVSAGDVSQINQRAVLSIPEFKQKWNYDNSGNSNGQASKDWTFVAATTIGTNPAYRISSTFPGDNGTGFSKSRVPVVPFCLAAPVQNAGSCPFISTETYKGILVGDVSGNFASIGSGGTLRIAASDNRVIFDLTKAISNGDYLDIPVSVTAGTDVNSLDFSFQFNEGNLTYNSIVNQVNYLQDMANFNTTDRTLRFTSNSLQAYDQNSTLVYVRFVRTTASQIGGTDLYSLKGYMNDQPASVQVITDVTTGVKDTRAADHKISVYPNPASNLINVEVEGKAVVQLFDMQGRQVIASVNVNQKEAINTESLAAGVYTLKISNDSFVTTKQIVISK